LTLSLTMIDSFIVMGLLFGFGHSYRKTHHVCFGKPSSDGCIHPLIWAKFR